MTVVVPDPETIGGYNVQKYPWFSPQLVVNAFVKLSKFYGSNVDSRREFKRAKEMFVGAIALLGAYELHPENKYFLQANQQSDSPDVVAVKQTERVNEAIMLEIIQLEIVELNDYSPINDAIEFLKKTKLSPKKSYNNKTMIIYLINKQISVDRVQISEQLKVLKPKSTIYIVGKVKEEDFEWMIFSPYPNPTKVVVFKPSITMNKYDLPSPIRLHKGSVKKISYEKTYPEETTIYDIFNLNEIDLKKYRRDYEGV